MLRGLPGRKGKRYLPGKVGMKAAAEARALAA